MDYRFGLAIGVAGSAALVAAVAVVRRSALTAGLTAVTAAGSTALADSAPVNGVVQITGLSRPVEMVQDPANDNVQYIVQQSGRIRVVENGALNGDDLLDITGTIGTTSNERGLLGLAFPPQGVGRSDEDSVYINHTNFPGGFNPTNTTVIARYQRTAPGAFAVDPASRIDILVIVQDFENHNGGHLEFGPDGMLYLGMGDGGSAGDPNNRSQSHDQLLGKMLRIDVEVADPLTETYTIPADNPFIGATGALTGTLPEIWAFGIRNPWRWSFDSFGCAATDAMFITDVGQDAWEEINYLAPDYDPTVTADRINYGWRHREGPAPFDTSIPAVLPTFVEPMYVYDHSQGFSITGGYVYRGAAMPQNRGRYFFADFVTNRVWSVDVAGGVATDLRQHFSEIFTGGVSYSGASSFAQDADGELYILNYGSGQIIRLVPALATGDLNGDGAVDTADLGILIAAFGTSTTGADINADCIVDTADLGALIANFGN